MNSQLPVSLAVPSSQPTSGIQYLVLSQDGYSVTVSNSVCSPLAVGELLSFQGSSSSLVGVVGVVTEVTQTKATLLLNILADVTLANPLDWLPLTPAANLALKYPSSLLGSLLVYCVNTASQVAGYLGWTLTDGHGNVLALGNDLNNQNICTFSGTGNWGTGTYKLEVRSFQPITLQPIRYGVVNWKVTNPVSSLGAGGVNDTQGKLILA